MVELTAHIQEIGHLCNSHKVRSLFAFGSVVAGDLKDDSDIDLVIDIDNSDPIAYTDDYFAVKFQLENILKRDIDLLEEHSIRNPLLKKRINETKVLVYAR